ncbi:MAG: FAD-dependent oxidoreductase, partial [Bacteroidota bacterium]
IRTLQAYIEERGGSLKTKSPVVHIQKEGAAFTVSTKKGEYYKAPLVISNVPVWNMADIVGSSEMSTYFSKESETYDKAWGALTLGLVTDDVYPHDASIHHQIHLDKPIPHTASESCFVSMSNPGDVSRAEAGLRTLNVSCHASPEYWFSLNGNYDQAKAESEQFIIEQLRKHLPGFADAQLKVSHTATPVTWQKWVYRKKGRVGGIPQSMARSLLKWTPHSTPFRGLYLVGDTTYPGQGIPGVTLSGINVYWRVRQHFKSLFS